MTDDEILNLYWARSEWAINATEERYGPYCRAIALHILGSERDAEECVNDALFRAWSSIPPNRPEHLRAYLGKIARNAALNRWERGSAQKRGQGQTELALSELAECVPDREDVEKSAEGRELTQAVENFLLSQPFEKRNVFLQRYWYLASVKDIGAANRMSESKVKSLLYRMRKELRNYLEQEGLL